MAQDTTIPKSIERRLVRRANETGLASTFQVLDRFRARCLLQCELEEILDIAQALDGLLDPSDEAAQDMSNEIIGRLRALIPIEEDKIQLCQLGMILDQGGC